MEAICVIKGDVDGVIIFKQQSYLHPLVIEGHLMGLPKGLHGFHVHEFGDSSNGCTSAGEHFNPTHKKHGAPNALERHVGDLGNVESRGYNSLTQVSITDNVMTLYGDNSVLGRSLVVHAERDDLGLGDSVLSQTTGNSGGRLGCGVIGVKKVDVKQHNGNAAVDFDHLYVK
ncbi:sod [Lambdina fiscellaria nucleopolyhedrovirus]|uniref:superoxide dismutase n=1 Tax=Lambdina fiscellaria nucleopolyhedrovirus TaxID=1642929 RepID=A0A0E3Z7D4_9ABAC|nr:sod [Lambdina fiscellaria nucleopolyhedrovirus]AKC91661.1 sod [Lambdina fiscellaria nucleopolyhedrovirus]